MAKWRMLRGTRTFPLAALLVMLLAPLDKANAMFFVFASYDHATSKCQGNLLAITATLSDVALLTEKMGQDLGYVPAGGENCHVMRYDIEEVVVYGTRPDNMLMDWSAWLDAWFDAWSRDLMDYHNQQLRNQMREQFNRFREEWARLRRMYTPPPIRQVGLCRRPVGFSLPSNWGHTTRSIVLAFLPEHHDVRTKTSSNTVTKGFFPVSMEYAFVAYVAYMRYRRFRENSLLGWVRGEVRDSVVNDASCALDDVTKERFDKVHGRITNSSLSTLYHLSKFNCQHWAGQALGP